MLYDISKISKLAKCQTPCCFLFFRYWRTYNVTMPDGTKHAVVLSATEGRKLMSGGDLKLYTLL